MNKVYIVISEYSEDLSKRQPWYTIKSILMDMKRYEFQVEIVPLEKNIPENYSGLVIKIFGLKDLLPKRNRGYKLYYLMTFPVYRLSKFFLFPIITFYENWRHLKRIFFLSALPGFLIKSVLKKSAGVIVISDRSEKYLSSFVPTLRYFPFMANNWGGRKRNSASGMTSYSKEVNSSTKARRSTKKVGYFGPPFTTRCFDNVVDFFIWLNKKNSFYYKKILTRIERDELKIFEIKYLKKLFDDKNCKIVSGFLSRDALASELLDIDVLILPFKIVMSELPVVVLEALELGIAVVTTEDSGIETLVEKRKDVLMLPNFNRNYYEAVLNFLENFSNENFDDIQKKINEINHKTLEYLCQK